MYNINICFGYGFVTIKFIADSFIEMETHFKKPQKTVFVSIYLLFPSNDPNSLQMNKQQIM